MPQVRDPTTATRRTATGRLVRALDGGSHAVDARNASGADGKRGRRQAAMRSSTGMEDSRRIRVKRQCDETMRNVNRSSHQPDALEQCQVRGRTLKSICGLPPAVGQLTLTMHDIVDFVGKDTDCKFVHSCSYKGCGQAHSASTHMQGQSYNHTR